MGFRVPLPSRSLARAHFATLCSKARRKPPFGPWSFHIVFRLHSISRNGGGGGGGESRRRDSSGGGRELLPHETVNLTKYAGNTAHFYGV